MDQRSQFVVHRVATQSPPLFSRHPTKPDPFPKRWTEPTDSLNPTSVRRENSDYLYEESHFGCVRVLVWAIVFEGGLAIAVSAFWWLPHLIR